MNLKEEIEQIDFTTDTELEREAVKMKVQKKIDGAISELKGDLKSGFDGLREMKPEFKETWTLFEKLINKDIEKRFGVR